MAALETTIGSLLDRVSGRNRPADPVPAGPDRWPVPHCPATASTAMIRMVLQEPAMPTRLATPTHSMPPVGLSAVASSAQHAPDPVMIPRDEQAVLLRLARAALATATGLASPEALGTALRSAAGYDTPAAVFVTLTEAGELRGCMGGLTADRPIAEAVADAACAAAQVTRASARSRRASCPGYGSGSRSLDRRFRCARRPTFDRGSTG